MKTGNSAPNCAKAYLRTSLSTIYLVEPLPKVSTNAAAQKKAANEITIAKKKLTEFEQIYNISTDPQFKYDTYIKISNLQTQIRANKDRIAKLKRNAQYTQNLVKVRIIENLRKNLEENYNVYMVLVAGVLYTDTHEHIDSHYCLASIKCAKQFVSVFSDMLVVISQDNKAKIGLGIPAIEFEQKLIPLVYLLMKPDHINLTIDSQYDSILKTGREIRPIWVLLVDGGPDKNPRHLKNIKLYCKVNNQELALKNFQFVGEALYNIWCYDLVFGKCVNAQYVKEFTNPYTSCCGPPHAKEAMNFLQINNGFLPPITKAKDGHFTNPIHLLEYYDLLKISNYNQHCPSLDETTYS
ncbi:16208_t:CDS:2 [Gigaspora margarita]|uniref:16208_t:CDS:1 n=1 Tax=Gigaspora margarita TaxID=4874 RepID=A0ABN7UD10_GIGMA|nr:16208_t:CDS:2 [Gigaspora margarita]